jgi:hypothetical protein
MKLSTGSSLTNCSKMCNLYSQTRHVEAIRKAEDGERTRDNVLGLRAVSRLMAVGFVMLATSGPVAAQSMWEVEHARMGALAGGPTNGYDAWLLERYGCYSGTRSAFCRDLTRGQRPDRMYRRRVHRDLR